MTYTLSPAQRERLGIIKIAQADIEAYMRTDAVAEVVKGIVDEALREMDTAGLIEALKDKQHELCAYGTREGDGKTCDCKFSNFPGELLSGEKTGCAEVRQLIWTLTEIEEIMAEARELQSIGPDEFPTGFYVHEARYNRVKRLADG